MRQIHRVALLGFVGLFLTGLPAEAYPTYRDGSPNCSSCHAGFVGGFGAPLHDTHLTAVSDCAACHVTPGSTPVDLASSGAGPGCGGCHLAEGLRAHHTNAGAPPDDFGLTCANCHSSDPPPLPESTFPPYYGVEAPGLDPCDGSEELGATATFSLDNDGDLLYDAADPDCATGCGSAADCDDGEYCNGAETCDITSGDCLPGTPVGCDDGVGCTIDSCNETADSCENVPNDAECDNGMFCDGAETCDAQNDCLPGEPPCDPANESCDEAADTCLPLGCTADAECDDGVFCNGSETCDTAAGECRSGAPVDCDDSVACTVDVCDEATDACENPPDDGFCDNRIFCDGVETCDPLLDCRGGMPVDCDDGDVCTDDACDETTDDCVNVSDPGNDPSCATEVECFNDLDDDDDGFTDCADTDCDGERDGPCDTGEPGICATGTLTCAGGFAECVPDDVARPEGNGHGNCDDGLDNDCDGATDAMDAGCAPTGPNVHLRSVTDCSNCHWTDRETGETDLRPLHGFNCGLCHTSGFQGTFLGPLGTWDEECTACHNAFTPETGFREEPTKGHRCVVCHGEQRSTRAVADFHRKHVEEANCVVCHGYIPEPAPPMGPRGVCAVCHGGNGGNLESGRHAKGGDSSTSIHRRHVPDGLSCLECHGGVRPPIDANQVCNLCHGDQGDDDEGPREIHEKHTDLRMDCGACHADANLQDDRVPMPPIDDVVRASVDRGGEGACSTCHKGEEGHDGEEDEHDDLANDLIKSDDDDPRRIHEEHVAGQWQWCFNCHAPEDPRPQGLAPPATDAASSCVICHDSMQFDAPTPFRVHEQHAGDNKCYACHQTVPPIFDWPESWGRIGGFRDDDGDGYDDHEDCDDDDPHTHPGAPEVNDGKDNQCRGDRGHLLVDEVSGMSRFHTEGDSAVYDWPGQLWATSYEVARCGSSDFYGRCDYIVTVEPGLTDDAVPRPGRVFYYLSRPLTPHPGSWGADSSGVERDHIDR